MNAEQARQLTKKAQDRNMNYQRQYVMGFIAEQARIGRNSICESCWPTTVVLFDEDWDFFERLGYNVIRPIRTSNSYTFGIIYW